MYAGMYVYKCMDMIVIVPTNLGIPDTPIVLKNELALIHVQEHISFFYINPNSWKCFYLHF